eukprot:3840411-Rhodomonas_salina.1
MSGREGWCERRGVEGSGGSEEPQHARPLHPEPQHKKPHSWHNLYSKRGTSSQIALKTRHFFPWISGGSPKVASTTRSQLY